mmetsp:Transcript_7002/g.22972  ORF Transcript_7002/g.22972 Transcript_7002/m.22972 type:complete len:391 (+) Transcript_7002:2388-3560(+)
MHRLGHRARALADHRVRASSGGGRRRDAGRHQGQLRHHPCWLRRQAGVGPGQVLLAGQPDVPPARPRAPLRLPAQRVSGGGQVWRRCGRAQGAARPRREERRAEPAYRGAGGAAADGAGHRPGRHRRALLPRRGHHHPLRVHDCSGRECSGQWGGAPNSAQGGGDSGGGGGRLHHHRQALGAKGRGRAPRWALRRPLSPGRRCGRRRGGAAGSGGGRGQRLGHVRVGGGGGGAAVRGGALRVAAGRIPLQRLAQLLSQPRHANGWHGGERANPSTVCGQRSRHVLRRRRGHGGRPLVPDQAADGRVHPAAQGRGPQGAARSLPRAPPVLWQGLLGSVHAVGQPDPRPHRTRHGEASARRVAGSRRGGAGRAERQHPRLDPLQVPRPSPHL